MTRMVPPFRPGERMVESSGNVVQNPKYWVCQRSQPSLLFRLSFQNSDAHETAVVRRLLFVTMIQGPSPLWPAFQGERDVSGGPSLEQKRHVEKPRNFRTPGGQSWADSMLVAPGKLDVGLPRSQIPKVEVEAKFKPMNG